MLAPILAAVCLAAPAQGQPPLRCTPLNRGGKLPVVSTQGRLELTPRMLGWSPTQAEQNGITQGVARTLANVNGCRQNLRFLDWRPAGSPASGRGPRLVAVVSGEQGRYYNPIRLRFEINGDRNPFVDLDELVYSEFEPRKRSELRVRIERAAARIDEDVLLTYASQHVPLVEKGSFLWQAPPPGRSLGGYLAIPGLREDDLLAKVGSLLRITWNVKPAGSRARVFVKTIPSDIQRSGWKDAVQGEVVGFIFTSESIEAGGWDPRLPGVYARRVPETEEVYVESYTFLYSRNTQPRVAPMPSPGG